MEAKACNEGMSKLRDRVLNAGGPARTSNKNFCYRVINKRMASPVKTSAAKRARTTTGSTPRGTSARRNQPVQQSTPAASTSKRPREDLSSVSSIESAENSAKLASEPSDSSDLAVLNAAMDLTEQPTQAGVEEPSVLSNSSDFDLLVSATCQAEMLNHRSPPRIHSSSSSADTDS